MSFFNYPEFYEWIAGKKDYRRFVEVGVYAGDSLMFLAEKLRQRGVPFELYGVDLWELVRVKTDYNRTVDENIRRMVEHRISQSGLDCVKMIQDDSAWAASQFEDSSLDFVFIDANHSYDYVRRDILAWQPKVKSGGIISGHDFREPCGVEQAVEEIFGKNGFNLWGTVWYRQIP